MPRVIFLVTEDWYFLSHRLALAKALLAQGAKVVVATAAGEDVALIRSHGFEHRPIAFRRKSVNVFSELVTLFQIWRLYREVRPDLVHHIAMKPVVYGSLAARLARVPAAVHTLTGLGYAFTSRGLKPRLLRVLLKALLRVGLHGPRSRLIVQNHDDSRMFIDQGLVPADKIEVILGSGVDTARFAPLPRVASSPSVKVLFPARLLWDKGIGEFVEASRLLAARGVNVKMVLCGFCDRDNPAAVPEPTVREWMRQDLVEWIGFQKDMPRLLADCDIVCLPSYREGVPLALIEAASAGKPIVTTDTPGCREIVKHELNGLLIPVRDARALAWAIERLALSPEEREEMGRRGREKVLDGFSIERVVKQTFQVYRVLLRNWFPRFLEASP